MVGLTLETSKIKLAVKEKNRTMWLKMLYATLLISAGHSPRGNIKVGIPVKITSKTNVMTQPPPIIKV